MNPVPDPVLRVCRSWPVSLVLYSGLILVAGNLFASTWGKATDEVNPWGASTLEWKTATPPPEGNFAEAPRAGVGKC